jgi:hypothetical protein|eukprot:Transcript_25026.p3 GENE.Transcript_25026~~Transcript_25026.p3  ORF type:complete len:132 (-),score=14.88 Transcript_25026:306-701(-)
MASATALALLASAHGFVCPPCGSADQPPCPAVREAGEACGGACNNLGTCGEGLLCFPQQRGYRIRGAVALLQRITLGPTPPGRCKCATLCEEQEPLNATALLNATAARGPSNGSLLLTMEDVTAPSMSIVL